MKAICKKLLRLFSLGTTAAPLMVVPYMAHAQTSTTNPQCSGAASQCISIFSAKSTYKGNGVMVGSTVINISVTGGVGNMVAACQAAANSSFPPPDSACTTDIPAGASVEWGQNSLNYTGCNATGNFTFPLTSRCFLVSN